MWSLCTFLHSHFLKNIANLLYLAQEDGVPFINSVTEVLHAVLKSDLFDSSYHKIRKVVENVDAWSQANLMSLGPSELR